MKRMLGLDIELVVVNVLYQKGSEILSRKAVVLPASGNVIFREGEKADGEVEDLIKSYLQLQGIMKEEDWSEKLTSGLPKELFVQ